jgi:amino acid adenylation domain-containing protein
MYPLSMSQRDMWFQSQIHAEEGLNNLCVQVTMDGKLDVECFRRAWQAVVNRHDVLRTVFIERDGVPYQKVLPTAEVRFSNVDLSTQAPDEQARSLKELEHECAAKAFDFEHGPLLRYCLARIADEQHTFLFAFSHLIIDGIYMSEIFGQVSKSYECLVQGGDGSLTPLNLQYPEFAARQIERFDKGPLADHQTYWHEQLQAPLPAMELPTDRGSRKTTSFELGVLEADVPSAVWVKLKSFQKRYRTTVFRTVLAAFEILLQQLTGEDDLLLGVPFTTLPQEEPELLGFFAHMVPVRANLTAASRFADLLSEVNRQLKDAQEHLEYPLFEAARGLKIARNPHRPLFPVVITEARALESTMGGVRMNMVSRLVQGGVYHLCLAVRVLKDGLSLGFHYNRQLFAGKPVQLIVDCMQEVLGRIANNPDGPLSLLEVLSPVERERVLRFGDGGPAKESGAWHEQMLVEHALQRPLAIAASDRYGALTYRELNERTNRVANWLLTNGIQTGARIGILGGRSLGMLTTILAVLKAGAAYVPLDPRDPEDRNLGMMKDAGVAWLAVDDSSAELGARLARAVGCKAFSWDEDSVSGARDWINSSPDEPAGVEYSGRDLAYIFYTSGSTGVPKGAMVERAGMQNHLRSKLHVLQIGPADVVAQNASHCFDISVWQFLAPLMAGARVVIYDNELVLNPPALLQSIANDRVTIFEIVPSYLELLVGLEEVESLGALRYLVSTAESLPVSLSDRWLRRFPDVPLVNAWGPTECSDDVAHEILQSKAEALERVAIGKPIPGSTIYVLNRELRLLPVGCIGEIAVGGVCVGRGYLGDPAKTAKTFIPDPFGDAPGTRLYRTGDIGRWRWDGSLEFLGRSDGQVKIRGLRIEIAEIEGVLGAHPCVTQAAAAVHGARLVGYWVGNTKLESRDLRKYMSERLPAHMIPEALMQLQKLPLTRTGKVDRRALPAPNWSENGQDYVAPRTATEQNIAEIWQEVLGLKRIGIHDNFFEIGGHSLNATRIILGLQSRFGHAVSIRTQFLNPTIAELASALNCSRVAAEKIPIAAQNDSYSLTPGQQPMWLVFNDIVQSESPGWGFPQIIRIEGAVDPDILAAALARLVERHDALRVTFLERDGQPRQKLHSHVETTLPFYDFSGLGGHAREEALRHLLGDQLSAPLTNCPPMVRLQLVRLADDLHCVVMQLPHIISDEWTEQILAEDLAELYSAMSTDRSPKLPELAARYVDYAEWHSTRLTSQELIAQRDYWLEIFRKPPEPLKLSTMRDKKSPRADKGEAISLSQSLMAKLKAAASDSDTTLKGEAISLSQSLMAKLKALASDNDTTLYALLLASLQTLLARLTGITDVVVGTAVSGRTHPDLVRIAGYFVNPLCLRSDLCGNPTFRTLLRQVHQGMLNALANQEYPFHRWLEASRRQQGNADFFPYSIVLLVEERPRDLFFGSARGYFDSLPAYGFDLAQVVVPNLSLRVSEGREDWCAELIPGSLDHTAPPAGMLNWWCSLLEDIAAGVDRPIGDYSLVKNEGQDLVSLPGTMGCDESFRELALRLHRSPTGTLIVIRTNGSITETHLDPLDELRTWRDLLSSGPIKGIAAAAELLLKAVQIKALTRAWVPELERVVVPAATQADIAPLRQALGIPVSAFLELDDVSDAALFVDEFETGNPLVGRNAGAELVVVDDWGSEAPGGIRGRVCRKDKETGAAVPLGWNGRKRANGSLEIESRQFDTVELDADELQELLR